MREVDFGLVTLGDGEAGLLLGLVGGRRCRSVLRDRDTGPLEVVCDAADLKINVVHLAELLCCLLVVAPRLRVKLDPVVTVLPLTEISANGKEDRVETQRTRALL